MYSTKDQLIRSKKIGEFTAPLSALLDIDDVFDGRRLCLIDQLPTLIDGKCADPHSVAYLPKKGAQSTPEGWLCEYTNTCKVIVLPDNMPKPDTPGQLDDPSSARRSTFRRIFGKDSVIDLDAQREDTFSDYGESDFDDVPEAAWNIEEGFESDPYSGDECQDERELINTFRVQEDDRKDISSRMAKIIDTEKYYVCASAVSNHVQVLWRRPGQNRHIHRYAQAFDELAKIPKAREFSSSRTCRINRGGLNECLDKIKFWQKWHSKRVCVFHVDLVPACNIC